jgi:acyl carrier protein
MNQPLSATGEPVTALERTVAEMIVSSLNLEVSPDNIQPDSALYGDGLGLDSIDILEVALVVSKHFGIQMKADSDDNFQTFRSLRSLTAYIAEHRTK